MAAVDLGTKGEAKGQMKYGAVLEEGNTTENPHEPAAEKGKRSKAFWGVIGLLLVGTAVALLVVFRPHQKTPEEQFEEYVVRFKKTYADDSERSFRFENFKDNLLEIAALRKLDGKADFGWNRFTDLSIEEFANRLLGREPVDNTGVNSNANLRASPSVDKVDWTEDGAVPPVRDQGYCGSCWAHATVATIESRYILDNALSSSEVEDFELSVQAMVSCDTDGYNGGCRGGDPPGAFDWVTANGGLPSESDYPFTSGNNGRTGDCTEGNDVVDGTNVKSWSYATPECWNSCTSQDEDTMAASVEDYGPITVCVNANRWQYYTGGVMSDNQCGQSSYSSLNHCVQLTGFDISADDADDRYWILRNSWAEDWGEEGYMRVKFGVNTCGVADEAIYVELE